MFYVEGEKKMLIAESRAEASDEMQIGFSSCSDERRQNQRLKRKTLSEAVLCLRSSCQARDPINLIAFFLYQPRLLLNISIIIIPFLSSFFSFKYLDSYVIYLQ